MGLQNERDALDRGSISAFATLGEALLDELLGISEEADAAASGTFSAKVIFQALAIGGLGEHARESEFAEAARAGEKQRVRDAFRAESAAEARDDAFVAEEFGETHGSSAFLRASLGHHRQDGSENVFSDGLWGAHQFAGFIETLNGGPSGATREPVIHFSRLLEMAQARFEQILLHRSIAAGRLAGDQGLGFARRQPQVDDEGFARQFVNVVFEVFDPREEFLSFWRRD